MHASDHAVRERWGNSCEKLTRLTLTVLVNKITRGHAVAVLTDRGPWSEARAAQPRFDGLSAVLSEVEGPENGRSDSARRVPYM